VNPFAPPKVPSEALAPLPQAKRKHTNVGAAAVLFGMTSMGFAGCSQVLDFGYHVDGPGIGLEFLPYRGLLFGGALFVGFALTFAGARRAHWAWTVLSIPMSSAVALFATTTFFANVIPQTWKRACEGGEGRACLGLMYHSSTDVERLDWARKGCGAGEPSGCERWIELSPADVEDACRLAAKGCPDGRRCLPSRCPIPE